MCFRWLSVIAKRIAMSEIADERSRVQAQFTADRDDQQAGGHSGGAADADREQ